jgi:hypothetical protein
MKHKLFFAVVTILTLVAISLGASAVLAQVAQPIGETIPYPGHLSDDAGQAVPDGDYDFNFALYDAPDGGSLLWSETQSGVSVQGGAFIALLGSETPLPDDVQANGGRWLAVGVRGPGETAFTILDQRQELGANQPDTANAGSACAHDHFGETWSGTGVGLSLSSDGVGGETLYVNTSGDHDGVRAYSHGTTPSTAGLVGLNTSTGSGVYGSSVNGSGVSANSSATGTALNILQGGIKVTGAGVDTDTAVFIHQAHTGAGGNMCPTLPNTTAIDNPLINGDPNAILIITINGGTMGSLNTPTNPWMAVSYDTNNMCGFGQRWLIANLNYTAIPNNAKFNVLVVKP